MLLRVVSATPRVLLRHAVFSTDANVLANPLRVCIIGAGPSGFYTAKYLLKEHEQVYVDMIEALPTPYGLVRSGVAPDHPEVKSVMHDFEKVAAHKRFEYLGNVTVGHDVTLDELKQHYHAIVLSYGASDDRELGVNGEHLKGVYSARAFVNWYNGHPSFRNLNPDLSADTAVIFGQGNVAIDCARILTKSINDLKETDISHHALEVLRQCKIKSVYVVGRRGTTQAAFTMKEFRELTKLPGVACLVDPRDLKQSDTVASRQEISEQRSKKRMHELLSKVAAGCSTNANAERKIHLQFFSSPVEIMADNGKRDTVGYVRMEKTRLEGDAYHQKAIGTGEIIEIKCGLVLRSIGYKSVPIDDALPFDWERHTISNEHGRVISTNTNAPVRGLYCTGWVKRGPSGIIGSNIVDARETVACITEDASKDQLLTPLSVGSDTGSLSIVRNLIHQNQPNKRLVTWNDVLRLHEVEEKRGAAVGKPREKITCVDEMLNIVSTTN